MSKFPHKNPAELHRYFSQLSLDKLIEINHSYGPHFESLESRIDKCQLDLINANRRLTQLQMLKQTHQQNYEDVEAREAEYQSSLQSVLADSNPIDRYIGRQAVGTSPMVAYAAESQSIMTKISDVSQLIIDLTNTIAALEQKKTAAVSELRILNRVIEEQKRLMPEPTSSQLAL
ncbi:hypothetical protein [Legionella tucsonensis]|uniref:Uncharacterized protein n=1 Tax=Legionella tucsonensis TaxID=40335 RepID=A0A0W0ZYH1_9GAMM|nr:hypothetical protein [Legionella tucsonensis]KTD74132.1 hypothetical protein Ltuc_1979 [Legionella tucsonensis]